MGQCRAIETPRAPKKAAKNLPVGSAVKRKTKKGNPAQKGKKKPSRRRFVEVKLRITVEDFARGQPYFHEEKYLPRYVIDAYLERVNRAEANNKSARARILAGNVELLEPVLREMHAQGKLGFLKTGGGD